MPCSGPRALFAISSLGLGHATRSLTIILAYLSRGFSITVVSTGNALQFLRRELAGTKQVDFLEMADYPPLERGGGWRLYYFLILDLFSTLRLIGREHAALGRLSAGYDFIFSDGRYGFYSRTAPCFILTHQVAFMPPAPLRRFCRLTERINLLALRQFDMILIPDFPDAACNLSGQLAHSRLLKHYRHHFIGLLSSYNRSAVPKDIDYLFVISGYLIEHKEDILQSLLRQARLLPGKKVFILGQEDTVEMPDAPAIQSGIEIYPMVGGEQRQEIFNRAKRIISRAGYTTIMDLVEHGKRGLLIPTPNQTEQEYLATWLGGQRYFSTLRQANARQLLPALEDCETTEIFTPPWRTAESLKKVAASIDPLLYKRFFSVIVPAHNEEKELSATLHCLLGQDYPAERYEIIVVENGSTDRTLAIARQVAGQFSEPKILVRQSRRGVSRAKNQGLAATTPESEWAIFCDADTHLGPLFLRQLNTWLHRSSSRRIAVGTCAILPRPANSTYARLWFSLYDSLHSLTKTSYSLQIARTTIARRVGFDPSLQLAEDLLFLKRCRRFGKFFFMPTDQVSTSTRRFRTVGYLRLSLRWVVEALLPLRYKRSCKYHVIR